MADQNVAEQEIVVHSFGHDFSNSLVRKLEEGVVFG